MQVKRIFLRKRRSSGWKNSFGLLFLVSPLLLLKTQLFEIKRFFLWKNLLAFFAVLWSFKNFSQQFITSHIVSRPFCPIYSFTSLKLTFFENCKASTQICATLRILSVSCKSMFKTQTLEKRAKVQGKNHLSHFNSYHLVVADFGEHFSKLHKVFKWKMCKF